MMDYSDEIQAEIIKHAKDLDPMAVEIIRLSERIKIFSKLRDLINQKQMSGDITAENILGWAYEEISR